MPESRSMYYMGRITNHKQAEPIPRQYVFLTLSPRSLREERAVMSPVRFASTPVLLGSGGSISKDPPCPMKLGTMRKVREMIEISLG